MPSNQNVWHFGVLSSTGIGHVNPLIALSQELMERGHSVTFFEKPKIEARVRQAQLEFCPIGIGKTYFREAEKRSNITGICSNISRLRFNLMRVAHDLHIYLDELPVAIRERGVDVLIVDEIALTGPTVAELLSVPYFVISTSVPHNFNWNVYPWYSGYRLTKSWITWAEDKLLGLSVYRLRGPIARELDAFRRRSGLGPVRNSFQTFPALAQITQLPECLDFPQKTLPLNFHYTGPFVSLVARPTIEFPWERLDGRPLIYACLGTTRNAQPFVLRLISEACRDIDAQLVISSGGRFVQENLANLPGEPIIVNFAPQLELLKRAAIVISHGGSNTVCEALLEGKPILAIPIAHDQPAVAARVERLKAGIVLPIMRISQQLIRQSINALLNESRYRDAAVKLQGSLRSLHGPQHAANIIEDALILQL